MRRRVSSLSCLRHIVCYRLFSYSCFFFFFNDTATTEIYTLSLHDALPISFGSLFAQAFHLSPVERKTLLVAGAAGGMTAIFATPVAAVLLAIELLLFEFKPRSFIPVACASAVAGGGRGGGRGRGVGREWRS